MKAFMGKNPTPLADDRADDAYWNHKWMNEQQNQKSTIKPKNHVTGQKPNNRRIPS